MGSKWFSVRDADEQTDTNSIIIYILHPVTNGMVHTHCFLVDLCILITEIVCNTSRFIYTYIKLRVVSLGGGGSKCFFYFFVIRRHRSKNRLQHSESFSSPDLAGT